MTGYPQPHITVDPLVKYIDARHISPHSLGERNNRAYYRAKNQGFLTCKKADELACLLDVHPYLIWGPDWYGEDA